MAKQAEDGKTSQIWQKDLDMAVTKLMENSGLIWQKSSLV